MHINFTHTHTYVYTYIFITFFLLDLEDDLRWSMLLQRILLLLLSRDKQHGAKWVEGEEDPCVQNAGLPSSVPASVEVSAI